MGHARGGLIINYGGSLSVEISLSSFVSSQPFFSAVIVSVGLCHDAFIAPPGSHTSGLSHHCSMSRRSDRDS